MSNVAKLKKRALDYEQKKQFDKALEAYMQVLGALGDHVDEKDVALFNRVGDLLLGQGNVSAAVEHYERAVDLYSDGGFYNNAIALCKKILRNAPGRNSIYYKHGRISASKGFTTEAKEYFLEYADRMQRIGHVDEAFRALKEFADLCPDQDDIRLMLSEQLVRAERKDEALEQLQLHYDKLSSDGRTQEAKATLERIRAIDPSHQPKTGVSRPTPKANDLVFIDVGFDVPATSGRPVTGSVPVVAGADRAPAATQSPAAAPPPPDQPLPLIEIDDGGRVEIAPIDGLSTSTVFDSGSDIRDVEGEEASSGTSAELITGFEETSLGAADGSAAAVAPLAGLEQSIRVEESADHAGDLVADFALDGDPAAAVGTAHDEMSPSHQAAQDDDELPILDISLDLVDDGAPESGNGLTFIFPEGEGGEGWNRGASEEHDAQATEAVSRNGGGNLAGSTFSTDLPDSIEVLAPTDNALRIEPLLQLPELETPDESLEAIDGPRDLPLISMGEDEQSAMLSLPDAGAVGAEDDLPQSSSELRFLDLGGDRDLPLISQTVDPVGESSATSVEKLPTVARTDAPDGAEVVEAEVGEREAAAAPAAPAAPAISGSESSGVAVPRVGTAPSADAEPTLGDLRAIVELNPDDWESRRRLAEALLEAGERHSGLAELERAMRTLEHAGELRSATAIVNEMIRVEPHVVRYHQKRVEYAIRANDRALLAEAYYSLAESLFQMGEIEKSRAVYARVLELSPGDPRARTAIGTIDDAEDEELPGEPTPVQEAPATSSADGRPHEKRADVDARAEAAGHAGTQPVTSAGPPLEPPPGSGAPAPALAGEPMEEQPRPRERDAELGAASVSDDFVNLSDWLDEDAPVRNTRMVVDVKEPEIEEQVDFAEMLAMFKQGVAANVDEADHEAHYDLGVAYKEMGLLDEAISEFQKALRGTGNRARTYEALGQCFVERGQHQIAVTILSRALGDKSYTDDMLVGVLYLLGYASESLGRWADAQRFYERVFAVDIEFRDIANRLAVAERGGK